MYKKEINIKTIINMLVAAIIIYIILAIVAGPLWPLEMFSKGGILGIIFVIGWFILLIAGLGSL